MDVLSEKFEHNYLSQVLNFINAKYDKAAERKSEIDAELEELLEHYDPQNREMYVTIVVDKDLQKGFEKDLRDLGRAKNTPYFGRVDFKDDEDGSVLRVYIGRGGIYDEKSQNLLVTDWRTPIANLYYNSTVGPASYESVDSVISGELTCKRTYNIKKGELIEYFDADDVTNDELLQKYTSKNADVVLKDIVATIQKDQNEIIRVEPQYDVIVQGVAGSGKTTVAMHRLAYLIYNHSKTMKQHHFVIIGTNRMFLSYVAGMLPDLGAEGVKQMVMGEFLSYLTHYSGAVGKADLPFKASAEFFRRLEQYVREYEKKVFLSCDVKLYDRTLVKVEEIADILGGLKKTMTERAEQLHELIMARIYHLNDINQPGKLIIEREIEDRFDEEVMNIKLGRDSNFTSTSAAIDQKYAELKRLKAETTRVKNMFVSTVKRADEKKLYDDFLHQLSDDEDKAIAKTAKESRKRIKSGSRDIYDLAAQLYIAAKIYNVFRKDEFKHIVIDEAQDFGASMYGCLSSVFDKASFTLLGDVSQNISGETGIGDWDDMLDVAFSDRKHKFCVLSKSYRNTIEIAEVANRVLEHSKTRRYGIEPVIRRGESVEMCKYDEYSLLVSRVNSLMSAHTSGTMALICRDPEKARALYDAIGREDVSLFTSDSADEDKTYTGGLTIFDVASVKGLEFDNVIICGASEADYPSNEREIKNLYVACTRALHVLKILTVGEFTSLLS